MSTDGGHVAGLAATPIKGMRISEHREIALELSGMRDNRRFFLIDARGRMVNGKRLGSLAAVVCDYEDAERRLTLTFPDGVVVSGRISLAPSLSARFLSLVIGVKPVVGPWSAALSEYAGQSLTLVEADPRRGAVDRGPDGSVSLISRASLAKLAVVSGESEVDARRFRMLVEVNGPTAHEEDGWVGRQVRIGDAVVEMRGHVGRCLVTTQNPESGRVDMPTLDVLASYRRDLDTTEPLAFGIYGAVLSPGRVRIGDVVEVL